jgi:endonuclease YncB( thermonuclease family)
MVASHKLNNMSALESATMENTKLFNLTSTIQAKVLSVYDGNTYTAAFFLPLESMTGSVCCSDCGYKGSPVMNPVKFKCKVSGIDTPELRTNNLHTNEMGYKARDMTRELILNKIVTIDCYGFDKHGHLLTTVFDQDSGDLGLSLVGARLAVEHDDGTKKHDWGAHTS